MGHLISLHHKVILVTNTVCDQWYARSAARSPQCAVAEGGLLDWRRGTWVRWWSGTLVTSRHCWSSHDPKSGSVVSCHPDYDRSVERRQLRVVGRGWGWVPLRDWWDSPLLRNYSLLCAEGGSVHPHFAEGGESDCSQHSDCVCVCVYVCACVCVSNTKPSPST